MTLPPVRKSPVKRPKQLFNIVEVIWDDAAAQEPSWAATVEATPALVISVGFLVLCNRKYIVIAQDCDGDGEHNGRTQIPVGMVQTMKVLKKKDA